MEVSTMFRYYMSFLLLWLLVLSNTYAGEVVTVIAKDYKFQPQEITVKVGTTVRWENHEKRQYHSAWFEVLGEEPGNYFFPGDVRERTFDKPGSYPYICEPHVESHQMKGVVHVVE
ncbi:MAG: plastocyanin/azurin family copper-binding protein [Candidatus Thiodiazotropha sp.]